jgi:hypothetical protein
MQDAERRGAAKQELVASISNDRGLERNAQKRRKREKIVQQRTFEGRKGRRENPNSEPKITRLGVKNPIETPASQPWRRAG